MSVFVVDLGCTVKYSLSPLEFLKPPPSRTPLGSGYISLYIFPWLYNKLGEIPF